MSIQPQQPNKQRGFSHLNNLSHSGQVAQFTCGIIK